MPLFVIALGVLVAYFAPGLARQNNAFLAHIPIARPVPKGVGSLLSSGRRAPHHRGRSDVPRYRGGPSL